MATTLRQKRGPKAQPGRVRVTVYLDAPLAEWGKQQAGGLSDLLRRLLDQAQSEQGQHTDHYPPALREAYQHLIQKKLGEGLSAIEEQQLARVRDQINQRDRGTLRQQQLERAATVLDEELRELRQELEALPPKAP